MDSAALLLLAAARRSKEEKKSSSLSSGLCSPSLLLPLEDLLADLDTWREAGPSVPTTGEPPLMGILKIGFFGQKMGLFPSQFSVRSRSCVHYLGLEVEVGLSQHAVGPLDGSDGDAVADGQRRKRVAVAHLFCDAKD